MGKMTMPSHVATSDLDPGAVSRPRVLWIGATAGVELGVTRAGVAAHADVTHAESPQEAVASAAAAQATPVLAVLAADRPGRFTTADALLVSRTWPLMPIVSVASSLVDGRRRSGPPLPGIEEVPWHDLPSRCGWWLAAVDAGLPTSLGLPTTARREERLLESIGGIRSPGHGDPRVRLPPVEVSVAAAHADDLEGLCDLLALAGHRVVNRQVGRPRLDEAAATLLWDVRDLRAGDLEWLRLLAANRPGLFIVIFDSFPRGDTVVAAMRAGAGVVLGRPVSLEAVCGVLLERIPANAGHDGLGRAGNRR
jgi:hypothetical protein